MQPYVCRPRLATARKTLSSSCHLRFLPAPQCCHGGEHTTSCQCTHVTHGLIACINNHQLQNTLEFRGDKHGLCGNLSFIRCIKACFAAQHSPHQANSMFAPASLHQHDCVNQSSKQHLCLVLYSILHNCTAATYCSIAILYYPLLA